jgi:hypothetical protein
LEQGLSFRGDEVLKFAKIINIIIVGIILSSCKETLPAYDQPPLPFSATMYHYPPSKIIDTLSIFENHYYEPPRVTYYDSAVYFRIGAVHQYEEVLEDVADVKGYVEIFEVTQPERVARIPLDNRNIQSRYFSGGLITLAKGDTFWLSMSWNGKFPNGIYPFDGKRRNDVPGMGDVGDYETITFKAKTYIQLFSKIGAVFSHQTEFKIVFRAIMRWPP